MNILVTSISKKVPLLLEVKEACQRVVLGAKLIGADTNEQAIGRFFVDQFWPMPKLDCLAIEEFIQFCQREQVKAIIPTRDGELLYFATHKAKLQESGIWVMVAEREGVERCLDKLEFYQYGKSLGYPMIETLLTVDEAKADLLVVKERYGAGSMSLGLGLTHSEVEKHAKKLEEPIFQPYIQGKEYSVDVYIERDGKVKGTIVRGRNVVVNGESQVTTTLRFPKLEQLAQRFAQDLQLYGHVVLQVLEDCHENLHFVECNCRFGGASTLSVAAGLDSFSWFLLEAQGKKIGSLPFNRTVKEKQLVRYPSDCIFDV